MKGRLVSGLRVVPIDELKRAAVANTGLVQVARSLTRMAKETDDETLSEELLKQINKILDTTDAINRVIDKSAPVRD
jgi:hypothetical protein